MNIRQISFPQSQYYTQKQNKKQIYLHHTAGGPKGEDVYRWWAKDPGRVATCVVISRNGEIIQGFKSDRWAYHLGVKTQHFKNMGLPYINLDKTSIGVEICNWGQLRYKEGKFINYVNREVPESEIIELNLVHRGYRYYQSYTEEQINSVKELLLYWGNFYKIPLNYNEDIWDLTERAYKGEPGVFTHNSVRPDKVDAYPHPSLISMLKSL